MIASECSKMSFTERKEKENLIERVLLKYRDKLSDLEKSRFRDYINAYSNHYMEIEQLLRELFILSEEQFIQKMVEYGVIMSMDPSDSLDFSNQTVEVVDIAKTVPFVSVESIASGEDFILDTSSYDEFNTVINKEKRVSVNPVEQIDSYEIELPNADTIDPNETLSDHEIDGITQNIIEKNQRSSILPTSIGGYINITLLVIILNAVGGLILWLMLTVFYSAMV